MELTQVMKRYCSQAIDDSKGAILFCVCRGKISEGIDFTDKLARAVVVVGVPFPPSADTWVCTKMKYLDSLSTIAASKSEKGKDWYFLSTVRAMNQAVGRVIRHKDDFGAVLLCDNRFNQQQFQDNISRWVKDSLKSYESYSTLLESIAAFFQTKKEAFTSLDKLLNFGGVGSVNPLSERSIENNKITSHTFEHKSAHTNAQVKRHPELSYAPKFASSHQFTAIFAENQKTKDSQLNSETEEQSDKPAQFADEGLLQNGKKFDLERSYSSVPKRKNQIYQQKRQNNVSRDLNDSLLSKKENSFDSQSLENSMSAAENSQSSKPFSKFPQTNAGPSLGFAAAAAACSATDWTSNFKEIAGRSQNRRSAISQASALMDGLNNSFDFNKRNNASEKKQASGGELSSNYISEIFREYEDQDSSDEDSRKKVIIQRRQKSSLQFLSNENSKNACTPLSFADQLKLNLRNITPPGQQSSVSPLTPRSFTPKAAKNFDKAMLCNNAKGLGSFNIGDIISMKPQDTNDARNQNLQTIKECPQQEENDHDNQKEMPDNQRPNFDDALMCPICYETPKNNHINTNCSHKACLECWKKWLNQKLTCPMCRTRCRMAYLEPCQ